MIKDFLKKNTGNLVFRIAYFLLLCVVISYSLSAKSIGAALLVFSALFYAVTMSFVTISEYKRFVDHHKLRMCFKAVEAGMCPHNCEKCSWSER